MWKSLHPHSQGHHPLLTLNRTHFLPFRKETGSSRTAGAHPEADPAPAPEGSWGSSSRGPGLADGTGDMDTSQA